MCVFYESYRNNKIWFGFDKEIFEIEMKYYLVWQCAQIVSIPFTYLLKSSLNHCRFTSDTIMFLQCLLSDWMIHCYLKTLVGSEQGIDEFTHQRKAFKPWIIKISITYYLPVSVCRRWNSSVTSRNLKLWK